MINRGSHDDITFQNLGYQEIPRQPTVADEELELPPFMLDNMHIVNGLGFDYQEDGSVFHSDIVQDSDLNYIDDLLENEYISASDIHCGFIDNPEVSGTGTQTHIPQQLQREYPEQFNLDDQAEFQQVYNAFGYGLLAHFTVEELLSIALYYIKIRKNVSQELRRYHFMFH